MCGIICTINSNLDNTTFEAGLDAIKHRGPDNLSVKYTDNVQLGHARLSIIDLSPDSHQPFTIDDTTLIFNGEMFNFKEEKEILEKEGVEFFTTGDTEVILKMYLHYGDEFISRVNGMFAITIYDKRDRITRIYRDRYGIKPLFYSQRGGGFMLCSELKGIFKLQGNPQIKWNLPVLASYLRDSIFNFDGRTFYEEYYQLEPGHYMLVDQNGSILKNETWYEVPVGDKKNISEQEVDDIFELLKESVSARLVSDVGFSTSLSGGVDSTLVTRIINELHPDEKLSVFSVLRKGKGDYDSEYVAKYRDIFPDNNYIFDYPKVDDIKGMTQKVCLLQDEPISSPSIIMQYIMYSLVRQNNIKVFLEGQGGDEVFLGYERYLFSQGLLSFLFSGNFYSLYNKSKLSLPGVLLWWTYYNMVSVRLAVKKRKWGKKAYKKLTGKIDFDHTRSFQKALKKKNIRSQELSKYQLRSLLNYSDRNSMNFGIEVRLPFLDYRLVDKSLQFKDTVHSHRGWSKILLRNYLKRLNLNQFGFRTNKNGFEAPRKAWEIDSLVETTSTAEKYFEIDYNSLTDKKLKWRVMNVRIMEQFMRASV